MASRTGFITAGSADNTVLRERDTFECFILIVEQLLRAFVHTGSMAGV